MSMQPQIRSISGEGKPRLCLVKADAIYTSGSGTTFALLTITVSADLTSAGILAGHRISSYQTNSGQPDKFTWAKVLSIVCGATTTITVDGWTNGVPSNGQLFTVDGFVMDLPWCYEMTETFDPDVLVHSLWRQDSGTKDDPKFRGWKYQCDLDYSQYTRPEDIIALRPALGMGPNDYLLLMPHVDQSGFNYRVYYAGAVKISRFGLTPGYKQLVLSFKATENLPSWPLIDGYGMCYGSSYGYYL